MSKAKELLEMLGQGTGPEGTGGTDVCVCPKCGCEDVHERGIPCNTKNCPDCNTPMTGKCTVGSKLG